MKWTTLGRGQFMAWIERYPRPLTRELPTSSPGEVCYWDHYDDPERAMVVARYDFDTGSEFRVLADAMPVLRLAS